MKKLAAQFNSVFRIFAWNPSACYCFVDGAGTQRSGRRVGADEDARGHSVRAGQRESAWLGSVRKETFPFTQHYWIDEQQDLIRRPVFE
jgi:hypothetical protein